MQPVLLAWNIDWLLMFFAFLMLLVYFRGWRGLHRRQPTLFSFARLISFNAGVFILLVAIVSPLDSLCPLLLQAHMVQHILIMMVAPPLLLLGLPALPLLCGLPATIQRSWLGPFLASPTCKKIAGVFVHPIFALLAFITVTWCWHLPNLYELALNNETWHAVEHACFLTTALMFWFPVIQPYPSQPIWPRWTMVPYLLVADIQNSFLSAIFSFASTPLYSFYPDIHLFGFSPLADQAAAGAIMWVASSVAFLIPAAWILKNLLTHPDSLEKKKKPLHIQLPVLQSKSTRWMSSLLLKRLVQFIMLAVAAIVIVDGFLGPKLSPLNLAGILPWIYWRGLVIIAILVAGNLFCWACPFMLVRELGKLLPIQRRPWPSILKNKWLAVVLFVLWLWMYEALDPWNSTAFTSWIIIGYFLGAFFVDTFFKGASFCKWVCPIGQFHFVTSMLSPNEIAPKDDSVCNSCSTQECIKGGELGRGCELDLFVPTKQGNLDCTFCLDCVRACPYDNAVLQSVFPATDLLEEKFRGSIRSINRNDLTALMLVLVFGAFANAAGMIAPVQNAIDACSNWMGAPSPMLATSIFILLAVVIVPSWFYMIAKWISNTQNQVAWSLLPIGVSMWAAHLLFHFVTSYQAIIPVGQRAASDVGLMAPPTQLMAMSLSPDWLLQGETFCLAIGFLGSVAICLRQTRKTKEYLPWIAVSALLLIAGIYIFLQPMQMRGMMG